MMAQGMLEILSSQRGGIVGCLPARQGRASTQVASIHGVLKYFENTARAAIEVHRE
jgi:hypothetical protein